MTQPRPDDSRLRVLDLAIPDLGVIAYAGVPLLVEGEATGAFCERARAAIERLRCAPVEHITISVGVAALTAGESIADALARADQRLYDAKSAGRNRVSG